MEIDDIIRVLVFVVPLALWLLMTILGTLTKSSESKRNRGTLQQREPDWEPDDGNFDLLPPELRDAIARERQTVQHREPAKRRGRNNRPERRRLAPAPPPLPEARRIRTDRGAVGQTEIGSGKEATGLAIDPYQIARSQGDEVPDPSPERNIPVLRLLSPSKLRQNYILTEILQPPVSLRQDR